MRAEPFKYFIHFRLIVTGDAEKEHLPKLFRAISAVSPCNLTVIRKISQRSPRGPRRQLKMIGRGKKLPDLDATEISIPVFNALKSDPSTVIVLVDDIEHARRGQIKGIFERYRSALDLKLQPEERSRAGVHFLANMLEAYFFAHAGALNDVLNLDLEDWPDDVEDIRHPKRKLKALSDGYREIEHGGKILDQLDLKYVLSRPGTCSWLRSCVAWICRHLEDGIDPSVMPDLSGFKSACHLEVGEQAPMTRWQQSLPDA